MKFFMELTTFVLENNYCTFRGNFYLQVFGCAMGSKLSPILAQYFMDHVLDSSVVKLPYRVIILKKFVDDILMMVPDLYIEATLECFNSHTRSIQFTLEVEDDEQAVPFLDTKVIRQNNRVKLKWYRKDTHSNKIIHFNSNHSLNVKINIIKQMKNRINKICHDSFKQECIKNLMEILRQNGYPSGMINKLLYAAEETSNTHKENRQNLSSDNILFASYPNINGLTNKLKNIFKEENVKIAVYNTKTVGNLYSKIKDPIPVPLKSNVVYQVECASCDKSYIGQTSQWVKSRMALHKSDITKNHERCALATHAYNMDHRVDFENVKILKTEKNYQKRLIHEMIQINKSENAMNKKTDTNKLSSIYSYLLEMSGHEDFYDGPLDE